METISQGSERQVVGEHLQESRLALARFLQGGPLGCNRRLKRRVELSQALLVLLECVCVCRCALQCHTNILVSRRKFAVHSLSQQERIVHQTPVCAIL